MAEMTPSFSMNPYMIVLIIGILVIAAYFIGRSSVSTTMTPSEKNKVKPMDVSEVANDPKFIEALDHNRKIEAIKILREHTGMGLKEAKETVEAMMMERDD